MTDWFTTTWPAIGGSLISLLIVYAAAIVYTRVFGVRSFAKMSGFDFAMTIAVGSVIAGTALSKSTPLPIGLLVLGMLFLMTWGIAMLRRKTSMLGNAIDNQPILVMRDGEVIKDNLDKAAMTCDDLWAKLREANAFQLERVKAVVVETTGDVSVIHGDPDQAIDETVLSGVRGA